MTDEKRARVRERVQRFRAKRRGTGMAHVEGWVPALVAPEVRRLIERLAEDHDLTVGPVRRLSTGKVEKL